MKTPISISLLLVAAFYCIAGESSEQDQFAYGIPVTVKANTLYELELPVDIYTTVTRGDLGDIRVFNSSNEVIPHAIKKPDISRTVTKATLRSLPFFPLMGMPGHVPEGLSLHIEKNDEGTIVDVKTVDNSIVSKQIVAYLLDAGTEPLNIHGLILEWENNSDTFVGRVTIEGSNDLQSWSPIGAGTLANLNYQGRNLSQNKIIVRPNNSRYLRISWPDTQPPLHLEKVTSETKNVTRTEKERKWRTLPGEADDKITGRYKYDTGGYFPVDRLRIRLPEENSLADVRILTGTSREGPMTVTYRGSIYKFNINDIKIKNPDISLTPTNHRYWAVEYVDHDMAMTSGAPQLDIGWYPAHLSFISRNEGSYILAYGSATATSRDFGLEKLLSMLNSDQQKKVEPVIIRPGISVTLGGDKKLVPPSPPPPPLPIKKWILWSVLIIAVIIMGWMTMRLFKKL